MRRSARGAVVVVMAFGTAVAGFGAPTASAQPYEFASPVFGLAAGSGITLFAADAGAGIVRLAGEDGRLAVPLPGVTDVAPVSRGEMWAVTGAGRGGRRLYLVERREPQLVANLGKFEKTVNPDGGEIDSNPFDLARHGNRVLVADAGGNALLIANQRGRVDWVATLPDEVVSTQNVKDLVGCPDPPPDAEEICQLPDQIPAQGVATSVEIGPDGAYYVTELKGFPAPVGESRVWRIERGTRHAACDADDPDSPCTVVADGFTSIVDLNFDAEGVARVVELDEASWFAVEVVQDAMAGGTVNACDTTVTPWACTEEATGLTMPMAVATNATGVFVVVSALIPGEAGVVPLP
jgi:hypothetical protein